MKLVLFDCDGTLVDSAFFIHKCVEAVFLEYELTPPRLDQTKSIIGLSLHDAFDILLEGQLASKLDQMVLDYKRNFFEIRTKEQLLEPLYDGIRDVITQLHSQDEIILGVVTGKSRRGLKAILSGHELQHYFGPLRTADDCPSKPHPAMVLECCDEVGIEPSSTYVIGDAIFDIDMAKNAGATSIGVTWGYGGKADIDKSNHIVRNPSEIFEIIG